MAEKTKPNELSVAGQTCQYLPVGSPVWCAAIITACDATGRASLYVLRHDFGGADWIPEAPHGEDAGCWRSIRDAMAAANAERMAPGR